MIFRLAYENCGLNPAKPDFLAGCGLAKLRLASLLSGEKLGQLLVNKLCMLLVLNVTVSVVSLVCYFCVHFYVYKAIP